MAINASAASGQPAVQPPPEFRPLYLTVDEIADGKRLAETSCAGCHSVNGISTTAEVPNLAGQRPVYLYLELKAYQTGIRGNNNMGNVVKFLSDDALVKVAAYYASLDPAQPSATSQPVASLDPVQAGKAAAAACAGCHGETGVSKTPGMPSLVALDPQYLTAAMKAYKTGQRKDETMKSMLRTVGDNDIAHIALYYALQAPERAKTPGAGDPAAGKAVSAACAGCHGDLGVSGSPATPSLAGQDAQYLATTLKAYKAGTRSDETMKGLTGALDDGAMKNLAAYYAAQQPQPLNIRKPLTTEEWAQRCDRCHGINGNSTDPRYPALAGQRADYLEKVLRAYQTGARRSPEMAAMSDVLTEEDVKNLAAHYARQKARAVVFVTVPSR
jgi:cytochrome c553